jgi:2'-5' RNA ligase
VTRAFVAVRPPDAVLDAVGRVTLDLPGARRTPRDQWHITLQFLGDDVDVDAVASALATLSATPAEVQLGAAGPLGNPRRSMVFAVFVRSGGEWLGRVAGEIAERLRPLGFAPDERPFVPHLTIARFKRPTALPRDDGSALGDPWTVREVVLFESRLGRGPARHIERAVIPLDDA